MKNAVKPFLKIIVCAVFLISAGAPSQSFAQATNPEPATSLVDSTAYFKFYSNFWINLHHFLFKEAKDAEKDSANAAPFTDLFSGLSALEQETLKEALVYYQENLIDKDLLFNGRLFNIKRSLIRFEQAENLKAEEIDPTFITLLNQSKSIYEKHFWPSHHERNQQTFKNNAVVLLKMEKQAVERLAELTGTSWPPYKIRVDLSDYGSWAGAYTTNRPQTHIVTGTGGERLPGDWLETVFHEASHALIGGRRGRVSDIIQKSETTLGLKAPRQLWHSILFYISGRVVQDLLLANGFETYELYMVREKVFDKHLPYLKQHLEPYVLGQIELQEAVERIISEANK